MIDGRRGKTTDAGTVAPARREHRSIGQHLVAAGVGADAVTTVGVLLAAATAVFIAWHWFVVSVALIIVGGLMDTLDGHVAKVAGTASPRGAFLDSVADRVGDSLIFGGLAWYFIRAHDANAALIPIAILAVSNLVSYQRAKAESLGFSAHGGMMERAERLIFLGVTLFIAFFAPAALVPLLLTLLTLTGITCVGRFVRVWGQATVTVPVDRTPRTSRRGGAGSWRTARRADQSRRARRDLVPLSTRLRGVFGASGERATPRRERAGRHRSERAFGRRFDSDR
ncbi:MAG: CDP-alcohol phosphatidyltransferase family protein [Acidimicrobiales bacterium]|jgi:CDP-diacylglycerol--glycerol-3-phosphate 3-phosphatidyltransferase